MKILIIDDDPLALAVAEVRLAKEGVETCCANGGQAGLDAARRERPDLVVLDLDMPDLSGFDVCRALKADPDLQLVPIIFLTASDKRQDKVEGLDLGAVDYVTKPFDPFELRARVRAALRIKHLHDLLVRHAQIDPLTELPDRRALMARLAEEWDRIQRHGGGLSLVIVDLDHFRALNEAHGQHVGNSLLQEVANVFVHRCGPSAWAARYGGEVFAIVVAEASAAEAADLAERCRRAIEALSVAADTQAARCTASFGVADAAGKASTEALIQAAQNALQRAKQAGRNRVEIAKNAPEPATAARGYGSRIERGR